MDCRGAPPRAAKAAPERKILSLYRCPVCLSRLTRNERQYCCGNGHTFDIASQGYVNLTHPGKKKRDPGDNAGMIASRTAFLESGAYEPLADACFRMIAAKKPARLLDAGCGEGYYLRHLRSFINADLYGIDLSRQGIKYAARHSPGVSFAVASCFDLPFNENTFDMIQAVFSPICAGEFQRALSPQGFLMAVYPAARHLFTLKQVLYKHPYENPSKKYEVDGFSICHQERLSFKMDLNSHQLSCLFGMTPYFYRTPEEGQKRLHAIDRLSVEADFDIYIYSPA